MKVAYQYFDLPRDSDIFYVRYKCEWCGNSARNLFYKQEKSLILKSNKAIFLFSFTALGPTGLPAGASSHWACSYLKAFAGLNLFFFR